MTRFQVRKKLRKAGAKAKAKCVAFGIQPTLKAVAVLGFGVTGAVLMISGGTAQAAIVNYPGGGFSIPDGNATGAFSDITVTDNFQISDVTVSLNNLQHTWIGDLIATITNVNTNTTVSLFNRVGPTPFNGLGDSSNLAGNYSFNDANTGNLLNTAVSLGDNQIIPSGNYFPTGFNNTTSFLSAFNGQSSLGTWRLRISDNAGVDTGSLGSWNLSLTPQASQPVPEPFTILGSLTAGGIGVALRRKRQQQEKETAKV
jgi:subtilisin-like proprotein convertase family protein